MKTMKSKFPYPNKIETESASNSQLEIIESLLSVGRNMTKLKLMKKIHQIRGIERDLLMDYPTIKMIFRRLQIYRDRKIVND